LKAHRDQLAGVAWKQVSHRRAAVQIQGPRAELPKTLLPASATGTLSSPAGTSCTSLERRKKQRGQQRDHLSSSCSLPRPLHLAVLEEIRDAVLPVAAQRLERTDVEESLHRIGLVRMAAVAGLPGEAVPRSGSSMRFSSLNTQAPISCEAPPWQLGRDHSGARPQGRGVVEDELRQARGPVQALVGRLRRGSEPQGPAVEDPLAKLPELTELLLIGAELREQPGLREHVGQALERGVVGLA